MVKKICGRFLFSQTGLTEIKECPRVMFPQCISIDRQFLYRLWVLMVDIIGIFRNILTILYGRCAVNEL